MNYIVVHKITKTDAMQASDFLYEILGNLYPGKVCRPHNDLFITVRDRINIDLRCGTDICKFGGLRPDYYYTESDGDVADILEQGAAKYNGKRLKNLWQVVQIVKFYMDMFADIDAWLEKED